jgi:hypothetical protein
MNGERGAMRCTAFIIVKGDTIKYAVLKVSRHRPHVLLVTAGWKHGKALGRETSNIMEWTVVF